MFISEVRSTNPRDYFDIKDGHHNSVHLTFILTGKETTMSYPNLNYDWWEGGYCIHEADVEPLDNSCPDCPEFYPECCSETEEEYQERNMSNRCRVHGTCRQCADNAYEYEFEFNLWMILEYEFHNEIWGDKK